MKKSLLTALMLAAGIGFAGAGENLLTNASFEESVPVKKGRWQVTLLKDWNCSLNSGADKCDITLEPGLTGKNAVRLHTIGKAGFCSVDYPRIFPVKPGDRVTANVMMRGSGSGYIRIYLHDAEGKYTKKYEMKGLELRNPPDWKKLTLSFTVPEGTAGVRFSLQTLRNDAEVYFDDAELFVTPAAK